MDKKTLLEFITNAHKHTYAAPKEIKKQYKCETPILSGHKDYEFVEGDFKYHDSYAGWSWPPGKEVIFYKEKPVWCMSYQGKANDDLSEEFIEKIYSFLKQALMNIDKDMPFRGPKEFSEGDFRYTFKIKGNYSYFVGQERVFYKEESVFFQDVMGSLIK
jgi:hypothetical protein